MLMTAASDSDWCSRAHSNATLLLANADCKTHRRQHFGDRFWEEKLYLQRLNPDELSGAIPQK